MLATTGCLRSVGSKAACVSSLRNKRKFTTKSKIIVQKPIVEIGGDEMSKIVSDKIKKQLIIPYVNLERDYYDCSLENRNKTNNEVVEEAAAAILKFNVGIKCSTITSNGHVKKDQPFPTPNSVFERVLNGTQFKESIVCGNINKFVPKWSKPVIVCRHMGLGGVKHVGTATNTSMMDFADTVKNFAESCFATALERKYPLYFTSKYTNIQKLDAIFHDAFRDLYERKYKRLFDKVNLTYEHKQLDDMALMAAQSHGGFVWAMKSYDYDLLTSLVDRCVGSVAMMVNTLRSHNGKSVLTQPAHGIITKHYKRHLKGKETSTNPISSIFAWTRGLQHRARLDRDYHLLEFAELLEQCSLATVEEGHLTRDLAHCAYGEHLKEADFIKTNEFIELVARRLELNITKVFPREKVTSAL